MAVDIRLPHITGPTEKEQLKQINNYLFQLAEQLQWAFNDISKMMEEFKIKLYNLELKTNLALIKLEEK